MKPVRTATILILCSPLFSGCAELAQVGIHAEPPYTRSVGNGPPPHAPAHGYRYRNAQGVVLQFDTDLGVYAVVDMPNVYFQNGEYMRFYNGLWQTAPNLRGPWQREMRGRVPARLKEKRGRGHYKHFEKPKGNKHWKKER